MVEGEEARVAKRSSGQTLRKRGKLVAQDAQAAVSYKVVSFATRRADQVGVAGAGAASRALLILS